MSCTLCVMFAESMDHLFFNCYYTYWVLREGLSVACSIIQLPTSIESLAKLIVRLKKWIKLWDLHWSILIAISFDVWKERNSSVKKGVSTPKEIVKKNCLQLVDIAFKENTKNLTDQGQRHMHTCIESHSQWIC